MLKLKSNINLILYYLIFIFVGFGLLTYNITENINSELENRYQYLEDTERKIREIDKKKEIFETKILYKTKDIAMRDLLEKVDFFQNKYNAKINGNIKDKDKILSATLTIQDYKFKSKEDINQFFKAINQKYIFINKLNIKNSEKESSLSTEIKIEEVYK
ncbi:hypothetical protein JCM14244_06680 [Venenivibrio stagnispumantis]|uniref:Uncharacterized protein n=1 Tax=Venenivibrio stagnispumantis TaxID=407998 RepID=A0AA45WII8_9AQUI|nr:hypothetical protein [Venenivibrio stagnispumantis]MCW4572612.1 hypothetical protein [Venenivibrio stagnispumantis]SMP00562.1 hypothetical protein SAMN06264868_101127 [Venenivibrio stagnispumantis]